MTHLFAKVPGTIFLENYDEQKFNLSSLEANLYTIYDYCVGLKDYQSTLISLEKELVYSQLYEHNSELNTLSSSNCYYLCAFCNNIEYFRNTILFGCIEDGEPLPTETNCQTITKLKNIHYYTFSHIQRYYNSDSSKVNTVFKRDKSLYLHYLQLTTDKSLNSSNVSQCSNYLWETHRDFCLGQAVSSPLTHFIFEAFMRAKRKFLRTHDTRWVLFKPNEPILPASFLHIQYPYSPTFGFVELDLSLAAYLDKTKAQINIKLNNESN